MWAALAVWGSLVCGALSESSYKNGSECAMQHTLQPQRRNHGYPQKRDVPFSFAVLDSNYQPAQHYRPHNVYTIEIQSELAIRGFLIQPRLATKEGFIIGHLRGGYFAPDRSWTSYGIHFQDCRTNFNNSITHSNWEPKHIIRASWTTDRVVGPVQFFLTVYHMREVYWERVQPVSGFLVPDPSYDPNSAEAEGSSILTEQAPPPIHQLLAQPEHPFTSEDEAPSKARPPLVPNFKLSDDEDEEAEAEKSSVEPLAQAKPEPEPKPEREPKLEEDIKPEATLASEEDSDALAAVALLGSFDENPFADELEVEKEEEKSKEEKVGEEIPEKELQSGAKEAKAAPEPDPEPVQIEKSAEPENAPEPVAVAVEAEVEEAVAVAAAPEPESEPEAKAEPPVKVSLPEAEPKLSEEATPEETPKLKKEAESEAEEIPKVEIIEVATKEFSAEEEEEKEEEEMTEPLSRKWSSRSLLRRPQAPPPDMKPSRELGEPPKIPKLQPILAEKATTSGFELVDLVDGSEEASASANLTELVMPEAFEGEATSGEKIEEKEKEKEEEEEVAMPKAEPTTTTTAKPEEPWIVGGVNDFAADLLGLPLQSLALESFQKEEDEEETRAASFKLSQAKAFVVEPGRDYCNPQPCYSGGSCESLEEAVDGRPYKCTCPHGWRGPRCERRDYCAEKPCKMGMCSNDDRHHTFACECFDHFVGSKCDHPCPVGYCGFEGKCRLHEGSKQLLCDCAPGKTGARCEQEIDECAGNPCFNGGTCTDLLAGYVCTCPHGFMGRRCHRPCQDVYDACGNWTSSDRCGNPYEEAVGERFVKDNCAASCHHCSLDQANVRENPLPPALEPLEWLVGRWEAQSRNGVLHPLDLGDAYNETLIVSLTSPPIAGVESLEFVSTATSPSGSASASGYITIEQRSPGQPWTASVLTKSKDGSLVVEEATVERWRLILAPVLKKSAVFPLPTELSRELELTGSYLREVISKRFADGERKFATKYYYKKHRDEDFLF